MSNIFKHNIGMKLLALFSAFFLWLYVAYQNPANEQVLPRVPLEYQGLPKDVAVVNIPKTVSIRIQGAGLLSGDLSDNDVRASVDLSEARVGNNILNVKVNIPAGSRLVSVNPERVSVQLDVIKEKQVPVQVGFTGQTKTGYKRLNPVMKPEQILVRGPQLQLDKISQAYVVADLTNAEKSFTKSLPLRLMDADGNNITDKSIQASPAGVEVFIPIVKKLPSRVVEVRPVITGKTATGYRVEKVIFDPDTITITGPESVLNQTAFLETEPINISGAQKDIVREVHLLGHKDISWPGKDTVKVVIRVAALPITVNTRKVDVELRNIPAGKSVKLFPAQVQIDWSQKLEPDNVEVWVDLTGLTTGVHEIPVQVHLPEGVKLDRVEPTTIQVDIQDVEPEQPTTEG